MKRAAIKPLPAVEELRRLFSYNSDTGELVWKVQLPRAWHAMPGTRAGTISERGYLQVGIARRYYLVHRLIWKLMTGTDPVDQIDHIDGDRLNNRWGNLRAADNSENMYNRKLGKNNRSGVKGVCWVETHKAWAAYITSNGKQRRLGRFKSKQEAIAVRQSAALRAHGEFARL